MGKQAGKAQLEMRVEAVRQLRLNGNTRGDIVQFVAKTWGVRERQADNYIALAQASITESVQARMEKGEDLEEQIEARRALRKKAHALGDYHLVLDVLKDEAKLFGLYPAAKADVKVSGSMGLGIQIVEVIRPQPEEPGSS